MSPPLFQPLRTASSKAYFATFRHAGRVIFPIAIKTSSVIWTSFPKYRPSVPSLTQTKSTSPRGFCVFGKDLMGLTLAYRLNFWRMDTATLLGEPAPPGVVVGPLKPASVLPRISHVVWGIRESPPFSFHHCSPPSHNMNSTFVPAAVATLSMLFTSSGSTPSPFMTAVFLLMFPFIHPTC